MNKFSIQSGYVATWIGIFSFIGWMVCFTTIALTSPLFIWTNLDDYIGYWNSNSQYFQHLAKFLMIVFAISFLVLVNSLYDFSPAEKKPQARLALLFAALFALLTSIHYFIQLSTVRIAMNNGQTDGILQFLQANPLSASSAINMLGWCIFLGLASFFVSTLFCGKGLNQVIRYAFAANGFSGFVAGIGYLLQIDLITGIFINLGVGAACLTFLVALLVFFQRKRHSLQ